MRLLSQSLILALALGLAGCDAAPMSPPATASRSAFVLQDVTGAEHRPFENMSTRAVLLIFVLPDCPIASGFAPEIQRIAAKYESLGVSSFLVNVDPDATTAAAEKHAREFGYRCPVILDHEQTLARSYGVKRVPEAVVIDRGGSRVYRGRIDDRYARVGARQRDATTFDLREALDFVIAGKPLIKSEVEAVGCYLPPRPGKE